MIYQPNPILYLRLPFYAQPTHPTLYLLLPFMLYQPTLFCISPPHLHKVHIVSLIILSLKSAHFNGNNVRFNLLNYIMHGAAEDYTGTIHFWWQDVGPSLVLGTFLPNLNSLMQKVLHGSDYLK